MHGASSTKIKVLRLRLKDKHAKFLRNLAGEVNFVWNYCNELQITTFNRERRFLSGYDFAKFTRGATKEGLQLHSQTVQAVAKCDFAGATFAEVNEAFSTQTCSACDSRSGPKGIAGLGIRAWTCSECRAVHDRNVNAAKNILAAGRRRLAEGIPALLGRGRTSIWKVEFHHQDGRRPSNGTR